MFSSILLTNIDLAAASLSALSVFALCLVLSWPYLAPDPFKERVQRIAFDRDGGRLPPPNGDARHARTSKPGQTLQKIFDRMNLSSQAENGEVAKRLRMAGFRGESPVVTFLTIRLLAPPTLFAVAIIYIYAVLQLPHPFFVKLAMATAAACCGYFLPSIYIRNKIAKRQKAFRRGWPDALDLTLICVEAGMSAERAFQKVSEEIRAQSPIVAEELELTTAELSHLPERRKAYENFAQRTGLDGVNAVMTSLIQAEKYGSPIAQALRVLAQESRDTRMAEAEKKAASLPPKLTVPMIVFFLPVLFAVIITPMAIQFATTPLH